MRITLRFAALITFACIGTAAAQTAVQSPTRRHVETLAASGLEGRMAGSPGETKAADYLAKELQRLGARPLPGQADVRLPFDFTAGSKDGGSTITVTREGAAPQTFSATVRMRSSARRIMPR